MNFPKGLLGSIGSGSNDVGYLHIIESCVSADPQL